MGVLLLRLVRVRAAGRACYQPLRGPCMAKEPDPDAEVAGVRGAKEVAAINTKAPWRMRLIAVATLAITPVIACSSSNDATSKAQQLTLTATEMRFEPANLTVSAGRPVTVTLKNQGTAEHDFTVMDLPATDVTNAVSHGHGQPEPGMVVAHATPKNDATARFTPTQPGAYEFYCSVPGHKDAGMKGTLTVQ